MWTNGETWFPAWDSACSQPNGGSAQNCVALIGHNGANNDAYQDRDCVAASYPFICEQIPAGTF